MAYNRLENFFTYDLEAAKGAFSGHKSHKTRRLNLVKKVAAAAQSIPCIQSTLALERAIQSFEEKCEDLETVVEHLCVLDPVGAATYQKDMDDIAREREQMEVDMAPILAIIPRQEKHLRQPSQDGTPQRTKVKIRADLKPDMLQEDSSPVEFATWKEEFEIYHDSSFLHNAKIREQQINLYSHMDAALRLKLKADITQDTPIFDDSDEDEELVALRPHSSCVAALTQIFKTDNPIFKRRQDMLNLTPNKGEKFSGYMRRLHAYSLECDIANITHEELITQVALMHCPVEDIRKESKKTKDLNWKKMVTIAEDYDRMNVGEENAKAYYTQRRPNNGRPDKRSTGNSSNTNSSGGIPPSMKDKCFRCGGGDHKTPDCNLSKTIECTACKKKGHVRKACFTEIKKSSGNNSGSQRQKKDKSRQVKQEAAADADASSSDEEIFEKVSYVSKQRSKDAPPLLA